ncbi:hypothetical protein F5146DRAFT_1075482 [Armillaria mellea]|nr:hypothetical protein F5146DRAFT_1075482 [Armillaria mellea]
MSPSQAQARARLENSQVRRTLETSKTRRNVMNLLTCVTPFNGTSGYPAIRLTCGKLCDVATPFVYERFYVDLTKMEKEKADSIYFLKELSQGRRLGRFIRALYFRTSSSGNKSNLSGFWEAISLLKNGETFFETIAKIILAAVPQMQALKEFQ